MTWLPVVRGVVERRLLLNYRADPAVVAALLPAPFEPQLVNGRAVVGICLIRLGALRPRGLPAILGMTSENAAHRVAVQWDNPAGMKTGVYIPQRHTDARLNVAVGDRLFPGTHDRADFRVIESNDEISVSFTARKTRCWVDAAVTIATELTGSELFASTESASRFFHAGSVGYSPTRRTGYVDGLRLATDAWSIEPAVIRRVHSSLFDDIEIFPPGTIALDSALVMRNVPVEWHSAGTMSSTERADDTVPTR